MTLGYIILGLLINCKPMTGYDLKSFFDKSINFFWSAELSQIYRELSRLQKEGLISSEIQPQEGRPDKKIYSVTELGAKTFMNWLEDFPLELAPNSRNEFLVRIFFGSKLPDVELKRHFERYVKQQEEELKIYREIEKTIIQRMDEKEANEELFYRKFTVRRGISFASAEIAWAKECIKELANHLENMN